MFSLNRSRIRGLGMSFNSKLYDQDNFYDAFLGDLKRTRSRVIIESPFITMKRLNKLIPVLRKLQGRGVHIIVNTKPLDEHEALLHTQAQQAITELQDLGVKVLFTVGHHRKMAIIDDDILWEGSLNILSQNDSCEFMRRINSLPHAQDMLRFVGAKKWM